MSERPKAEDVARKVLDAVVSPEHGPLDPTIPRLAPIIAHALWEERVATLYEVRVLLDLAHSTAIRDFADLIGTEPGT